MLLMENKWRAVRYGINGKLIDFGKGVEVPFRDLMNEYFDMVAPVAAELGSSSEIDYLRHVLENGTGADRQLRVWHETKDLKAVVDYIIQETEAGLFE
jgi:carboxylate-amine ligase